VIAPEFAEAFREALRAELAAILVTPNVDDRTNQGTGRRMTFITELRGRGIIGRSDHSGTYMLEAQGNPLGEPLYIEVGAKKPTLRTRAEIVADLLRLLEAGKERGIVSTEIRTPAWAGPDSDVPTFECSSCGDDRPFDHGAMCGHCERYFCDTVDKDCYDAHAEYARQKGCE